MISKRVLIIAAGLLVACSAATFAAEVNVDNFIVQNLSVDPTSHLNLGTWGIAKVTPTGDVATANTVAYYLGTGCNANGFLTWTGPGINSSLAAADTGMKHALGFMNGGDAANLLGITNFHGIDTEAAFTLIQYTTYGDANLDGIIDGTDYAAIDYGYQNAGKGWLFGDFTYDGLIDGTDYAAIDYVYQNPPVAAAGAAAAVPEPSTVILLLSSLACVFVAYLRKR